MLEAKRGEARETDDARARMGSVHLRRPRGGRWSPSCTTTSVAAAARLARRAASGKRRASARVRGTVQSSGVRVVSVGVGEGDLCEEGKKESALMPECQVQTRKAKQNVAGQGRDEVKWCRRGKDVTKGARRGQWRRRMGRWQVKQGRAAADSEGVQSQPRTVLER